MSTEELKKIAAQPQSLHGIVQFAFTSKISAYAALLQRKRFEIPKEVLYVLVPFLYSETLTTPMLNYIVAEVKELMGTSARTMTSRALLSEIVTVYSRNGAKRDNIAT